MCQGIPFIIDNRLQVGVQMDLLLGCEAALLQVQQVKVLPYFKRFTDNTVLGLAEIGTDIAQGDRQQEHQKREYASLDHLKQRI